MNRYHSHYLKNLLLPCLAFSVGTGIFSAIFITLFKMAVSVIVGVSEEAYHAAGAHPLWLPLLIAGAAALGLISARLLSFS